jgi:hypothetical protein
MHIYHAHALPPRASRGISDITPRRLSLTEIFSYEKMTNTADVTGGKPIDVRSQSISDVSRLLRHPLKKERGTILLFCPCHYPAGMYVFIKS